MILCRPYTGFLVVLAVAFSVAGIAQSPNLPRESGSCVPSGTLAAALSGVTPLQSPTILSNGEVTLQLCAPEASSVRVVGDWNSKLPTGTALTKNAQGVWSTSIGSLKPDLYTYCFLVDGVKTIDPNNVHSANDAVRIASYFIIAGPGAESLQYENQNVPHGEVTAVWYSSKSVASPRRTLVYTPPGYRTGAKRYPVLYLLHGWGGDENEWVELAE